MAMASRSAAIKSRNTGIASEEGISVRSSQLLLTYADPGEQRYYGESGSDVMSYLFEDEFGRGVVRHSVRFAVKDSNGKRLHTKALKSGKLGLRNLSTQDDGFKVELVCGDEVHLIDSKEPSTMEVLTPQARKELEMIAVSYDSPSTFENIMALLVERRVRARKSQAAVAGKGFTGSQVRLLHTQLLKHH